MRAVLNGTSYSAFARTSQAVPERLEAQRGKGLTRPDIAKVIQVYTATMTCDLLTSNGSTVYNVPILAKCGLENLEEVYGVLELPSPESYVLVFFVGDKESFPVVLGSLFPYANELYQDSQVPVNSANKQFTLKLLEPDMDVKLYRKIFKSGTSVEVQESGTLILETPDGTYFKWTVVTDTPDDTAIELRDINGNIILINIDGISVTDPNANTIVTSPDGIVVTDVNGNTITMDSSGMILECANGNTVEMGSSSVMINGNLEVLQ